MYLLMLRSKHIIFSHETALFLNGLSERTPFIHAITIPSTAAIPLTIKEQCKCYYVKPELHKIGLIEKKTTFGNTVRCYDLERTICDILRSRSLMNEETVVAALKNANGNITAEVSSITYPYGGSDRTLQKSLSYTYDAAGRLTSVAGSRQDGGVSSSVSRAYTYDDAGNRTQEIDGNVTTQYTYNTLDQMTSAIRRQGGNTRSSLTFLYDANGNQIRETDSVLGTDITCDYDPANQLTHVTKSENNVQTLAQENRYDGDGQRIRKSVQTQNPGNITQTTRIHHPRSSPL